GEERPGRGDQRRPGRVRTLGLGPTGLAAADISIAFDTHTDCMYVSHQQDGNEQEAKMSTTDQRHEIDLPAGRIRYREAGEGSPVVFVHGFLVDGRLWDGVVDELSATHRCLAPDWPIGAQQIPMRPGADLTPYGIADLISSFLEALDLNDVTIVGNNSGGAMSQ